MNTFVNNLITGYLFLLVVLVIALFIFVWWYLNTLYSALKSVSEENRIQNPNYVFYLLLPVINLFVIFEIVSGIADSFEAELTKKNIPHPKSPTYDIGLTFAITFVLYNILPIIGIALPQISIQINILVVICSIVSLISSIAYIINVAKYKNLILNTNPQTNKPFNYNNIGDSKSNFSSHPANTNNYVFSSNNDDLLYKNIIELINEDELIKAKNLIEKAIANFPDDQKYFRLKVLLDEKFEFIQELSDLYAKSEELYNSGDYIKALEIVDQLIEKDNNYIYQVLRNKIQTKIDENNEIENAYNTIELLIEKNQLFEAEDKAYELVILDNNSTRSTKLLEHIKELIAENYYKISSSYFNKKSYSDAMNNINSALSINPNTQKYIDLKDAIQPLLDKELELIRRKKKQKNLLQTTISIIVVLIIIVSLYFIIKSININDEWKQTIKLNSKIGYQNFIDKNPNSKYVIAAKDSIKSLINNDKALWADVSSKNSYYSYQNYCDMQPNGIFIKDAIKKIDSILWNKCIKDPSIDNYRSYIGNLSEPIHKIKANEELQKLEALVISDQEKETFQNIIREYFNYIDNKSFDNLISLFNPFTNYYINRSNASRANILDYHRNSNAYDSEYHKFDWSSAKQEKTPNGSYKAVIIVDFTGKETYTSREVYENLRYTFIINKDGKIIYVAKKVLSTLNNSY